MPEAVDTSAAVESLQATPEPQVIGEAALDRPKLGGFQRKVNKLTRRVKMLQQLVRALERRIAIQDEMLERLKKERESWTRNHPRR